MFKENPGFDGTPFYNEANWIGLILRGGFGTEMKWLVNILKDIDQSKPGFACRRIVLLDNAQNEWRDLDNPLDEILFDRVTDLSAKNDFVNYPGIMGTYHDNFRFSSHYFEAFDGSWRMHLPCDEQVDACEYKLWAGTPEAWVKLRPFFEPLPREEPPESGPLMQAYARNWVYLSDNPEIPRNVVAGLGPVRFAADAGLGWLEK
jgi:hypothetical protein